MAGKEDAIVCIFTSEHNVSGRYGHITLKPDKDDIMYQRVNDIRNRCKNFSSMDYWKNTNPTAKLYTYAGITYCKTPKVGCTNWLRILRFLAKDFKTEDREVLKPSDIDRHQTHYTKYTNIVRSQFNTAKGNLMLSTSKSFMFTRHPLTRLWSAYIDKFLLPDFWDKDAVEIAKTVRKQHEECVSDISFEEFLMFIIVTKTENLDQHWLPVHLLCSPCHTKFDVIGKQETFAEDKEYVIDTFGLDGVKEITDKDMREKEEIKMLVEYNMWKANELKSKCINQKGEIFKRLWYAFQLNGYIHRNVPLPLEFLSDTKWPRDKEGEFLDTIFKTIDSQNIDMEKELKYQKRQMMEEAYNSVPRELRDKIKSVYKYDFELFGYDIGI